MDLEKLKSLLTLRFEERNNVFQRNLTTKIGEFNGRGMLPSSSCVVALHKVMKEEFINSSAIVVDTIVDILIEEKNFPNIDELKIIFGKQIIKRKTELESIFNQRKRIVADSLQNQSMISKFRNLNLDERLVLENGKAHLQLKIVEYKRDFGGNYRDMLISKWKDNKIISSISIIILVISIIGGLLTAILVVGNSLKSLLS